MANPVFHEDASAVVRFEASRWPNGATCSHCGSAHVIDAIRKTVRYGSFRDDGGALHERRR